MQAHTTSGAARANVISVSLSTRITRNLKGVVSQKSWGNSHVFKVITLHKHVFLLHYTIVDIMRGSMSYVLI